jgi:hypothetical protein
MSNAGRIAVVAVIAVVAFGGAFLLAGDDDSPTDDADTDLAVGADDQTTTSTAPDDEDDVDDAGTNPCVASDVVPVEEAGYEVTVATEPDPPVPQGTSFEFLVNRDGAPVEGATVCMSADMSGMSHEGVSAEAEEVGPGSYELAVNLGMRGTWSGRIVVIEPGQATAASMPVSFDVQ